MPSSFFHSGSPYKHKPSTGNKERKFPTKAGWLTLAEISERIGLTKSKINKELQFKTMQQIMEQAGG